MSARAQVITSEVDAYVPGRIKEWLDKNYRDERTKESYYVSLKTWVRFALGEDSVSKTKRLHLSVRNKNKEEIKRLKENRLSEIEKGVEEYISDLDNRDFLDDYKAFIIWMFDNGYAGLTIRGRCSCIKIFFGRQDPRCKIDDEDLAQVKRTLMPKSTRPVTQDEILDKEQLKVLLKYMSIQAKAFVLFLLSTGVRVGAACKLKMSDMHLDDDPPWANIRQEITKGKVGGRIMWFSYETADAILEWHEARKFKKKNGGWGDYDKELVFNYRPRTFSSLWKGILKRADGGRDPPVFAERDQSTKSKTYIYHPHTLRKFFRTNMGLEGTYQDRSGIPDMIVHAWMGHKAYLNTYDKLKKKGMAKIYKENMHIVTINEVGLTSTSVAIKDATIEDLEAELARRGKEPIEIARRIKESIDKRSLAREMIELIEEIKQEDAQNQE